MRISKNWTHRTTTQLCSFFFSSEFVLYRQWIAFGRMAHRLQSLCIHNLYRIPWKWNNWQFGKFFNVESYRPRSSDCIRCAMCIACAWSWKKKQTLSCVCACNALNCIPAKRTAKEANKSFIVCDSTQTVAICHLSWWLQQESLEKQKCGNTPTLQIEIKLIVCKLVGVDEVACDGNNAAYELRKMEICISQNITNK